jgi:hypothetical protein
MPEKLRAALQAWRAADAECKLAEQELAAAMDSYLDHGGPPVPPELVSRVSGLRAIAVDRLRDSIEVMRDASERPG